MRHINRRESPRIDIKLRCYITAPVWMRGSMYTENISRNGILFTWRAENGASPLPKVGQIMTVEVELPANHGFGPKCIHCQGAVIRVSGPEAENEGVTVAVRLNYMDFRSFEDRAQPALANPSVINAWMS